jgi:hypothetical protein
MIAPSSCNALPAQNAPPRSQSDAFPFNVQPHFSQNA